MLLRVNLSLRYREWRDRHNLTHICTLIAERW